MPTFPNIPPGYRLRKDADDKTLGLERDPKTARYAKEAFKMRAAGNSIQAIREYLKAHGIERSYHGIQTMLSSRIYLGELRFGKLKNTSAHQALITPELFDRVQRTTVSRGRRPTSDMLLARLGVLKCGSCGASMTAGGRGGAEGARYSFYRCSSVHDCPQHVTISADFVERLVVAEVRRQLKGARGSASAKRNVQKAEREVERTERALDAALEAFTGLDDVKAAQDKLARLKQERDAAREQLDRLRPEDLPVVTLRGDKDWDRLTRAAQRALISTILDYVIVAPGRGEDRLTIVARS